MLKAACGLFLHEGIRNLSLNKIADRLGVTRHDLHASFGDKRELAELSVEYGLRQLDETLQAAEASSASPVEALIRTSVAVCDAFGQMSWKLQERQQRLFRQGVGQGYLLGEVYYEVFEQLFWQNAMTESRYREATLRVLFTAVRGSATERGRQEAERVREAMGLTD